MVRTRKNIENMEIYDYMKELSEKIWTYLFEDSLAHEAILQSLNELEQIIISRLLFIQQVVSERAMRLWINPNFLKKLSECIKNLVEAKILVESETKKDNYNQYKINEKFRHTMLNKIYKNREDKIFIFNNNTKEQMEKEKNLHEKNLYPTKEEITNYAHMRWNNLLHFIASPKLSHMNIYMIYNNGISVEQKHEADNPSPEAFPANRNDDKGDPSRNKNVDKANSSCYTPSRKGRKKNQTDDEEYRPAGYFQYGGTSHSGGNYAVEREEDNEGEDDNADDNADDNEDCNDDADDEGDTSDNEENNRNGENQNDTEKYGKGPNEDTKYDQYGYYYEQGESVAPPLSGTTQRLNSHDANSYYTHHSRIKRKKKKKKGVYAYKQNDLYYRSLQNVENGYVEEDNNDYSFFYSSSKKEALPSYSPCDSLIEVLKRKNFILQDDANSNKAVNMSREAFSWFLKDIRSRIISLVLEYLLIIDDGYVTNVAREISTKYKKENSSTNAGSGGGSSEKGESGESNYGVYASYANHAAYPKHHESDVFYNDQMQTIHPEKGKKDGSGTPCYVREEKKDQKKSELYVKETLLLILSISQCTISHPIYLNNLTKAQKEFINFGIHIGLFLKGSEEYVFVTPYALLLTINNLNVQNYVAVMNSLTLEGVCENAYNEYSALGEDGVDNPLPSNSSNVGDTRSIGMGRHGHSDGGMKKISEKYFHHYSLLQEERKRHPTSGTHQNMDHAKLTHELANHNLSAEKKMNENNNLEMGLIVQSNFKVYLYTNSPLKINILSHLCELQARTPNMVVGILTRRSVLNAYNSDITANQIIKFLESYAHPGRSNFKSSIIPVNVITQLKLWESERHRLTLDDAIVFKSFEKEFLPPLYQQIVVWANSKNYLLHYTPWPKNANSPEFDAWMKSEKYLCCIYESKNEIIDKIKEIREKLMKKRQNG
ncbi:transcription initiation factor TFIIH subunit 4 [Plasmodium inui San Antonio 1]|uniref:General transcription factor IIH subunit 4 n=1 Tax=Plasmodium inui San Antonio 1 TaxID=1237626 RepID=W7AHZ0_9APIC|nr:transcription initiation factor TFIIH subunit 4 [Plasmodium inui San Antonio 1]EUD64896.1 transcription initiation factor TFIIH subunit 4 [Plasmodium inui San Antonio 1]